MEAIQPSHTEVGASINNMLSQPSITPERVSDKLDGKHLDGKWR